MIGPTGHVSSDRLGEAAQHGGLESLRDSEQRHVRNCDRCQHLYGGYRLADRLLCADWREVKLPAQALARPSRLAALGDLLSGLDARALAPGVAALAIIALVGAAFALPRLIPAQPAAPHSPIAAGSASPSGSASGTARPSGQPSTSPGASPSGAVGSGSPVPSAPPSTGSATPAILALARIGGTPIAWSPDGAHLLVWSSGHALQIRDAGGRLTGTIAADAATWVSSTTIAIASHSSGSPASGSPGASSPAPSGPQTTSPRPSGGGHHTGYMVTGASRPETVSLIDVGAHVTAILPKGYATWSGLPNAMLVGSGSGEFTIASQVGSGSAGWQFVLWKGSLGQVAGGLPIAFSQDGSRLAVLRPTGASGGVVSGSLAILSVPSLTTVASFPSLSLRVGGGSLGSAYGIDAAFSPDGHFLYASGTLVNLSSGRAVATGKGGWLPDGTLVTSSGAGLLRWSGAKSSLDPRFSGSGTVEVARHGELIYLFGDGRPPVLLDTNGVLGALSLPGVRSVADLLISPTGRAIALDGRATDGSSIAAVAQLP